MSVNKLTLPSKENSVQSKINEIIDNLISTDNFATIDTVQNITGTKTFIGQKKIEFKQSAAADKLGFTCFNASGTELGAFEYRPNTIGNNALLNVNTSYSNACYVGFRYWGTNVNIAAPKPSTAGDYFIPINITDGNTTVTASNQGTVNISSLLPTVPTVDQTYDGTSANAQSGVAIEGELSTNYQPKLTFSTGLTNTSNTITVTDYNKLVKNKATSSNNISLFGTESNPLTTLNSLNIGYNSECDTNSTRAIALGNDAIVSANSGIQIGYGTNSIANSLSVGFWNNNNTHYNWQLLDGITGLIPNARISSSIARCDDYVARAGDVMNGTLEIFKSSSDDSNNYIRIELKDVAYGDNPSTQQNANIRFQDEFNNRMADLQYIYRTDGATDFSMVVKKYGEDTFATIRTGFDSSGNAYCTFPNTVRCDGQWIDSQQELISSAPSMNSSTALEYRVNLPNDGRNYEVMVGGRIATGSASGNFVYLTARGNKDSYSRYVCGCRTRTASSVLAIGTVIVTASYVASGSKNLYIPRSTNYTGTLEVLNVIAYRRIGSNS